MPKSKRCLDCNARHVGFCWHVKIEPVLPPILPCFAIAKRTNDRLARKMDAAKFLDEAERGLWDDPSAEDTMSFKERKRIWDNQAFHFKDEQK